MSRDYPSHPLPAALAALVRDGRLLLVQRAKEVPPRRWGLPGGLIELGETPGQAAQRELHEETGITAEAQEVFDVFDVVESDGDGRIRTHYIALVVRCRWLAGDAAAASDAARAGWFGLGDIAGLHAHPHLPRLAALLLGGKA
jgi:ADP-ribose pyrophosphatase YjhB (NUDIX family)